MNNLCSLDTLCVTISDSNGPTLPYPTTYVELLSTDPRLPSGYFEWLSAVQIYDWSNISDFPLILKTHPTSGYRWQWYIEEGIWISQWFVQPVCPTSIDNGGVCVYTKNTTSANWMYLSAFAGDQFSVKDFACVMETPLSPVEERNAKYATPQESGANRFRRLQSLGYV